MLLLLISCLALGDDTLLEQENEALREAIGHLEKEVGDLREESDGLREAVDLKNTSLESHLQAIQGYESIVGLKDEHIQTLEGQLEASEKLTATVKDAYEKEKASKNVGKVERTLWASGMVVVVALATYSTLSKTPVTINTGVTQ